MICRRRNVTMPERPLVLFAEPISVVKSRRYGGPPDFCHPPFQKQVERLSPKFNALQRAFEQGKITISENPDGIEPEYTLVLEVAGDPSGFEVAVRNLDSETDGVEWLFEIVEDEVNNSDDFYRAKDDERDDSKLMSFKYFCVLTNQRALAEILSLWSNFRKDEHYVFPRGKTGLRNVFRTLKDIHLWGEKERLEETGILEVWTDELRDPSLTAVKCEIELFYRRTSSTRHQSQSIIQDYIVYIGGKVITTSCIDSIGYHAILASIPRQYAERIVRREEVALACFNQIMYFKPTGQSIVLGTSDGFQYSKEFQAPEDIIDDPIVALFDGLPQEHHPLLEGLLSVDDPDEFEAAYRMRDRQHGTSMASLIARGDLLNNEQLLTSHKIYVRPIMKPFPSSHDGTNEYVPDDILIVDKIHEAVRRLFEPEAGKVAPTVRIINLSICIGNRLYFNMVSPLAKLLDWLSFKYRVLFIVSAGNHPDDIELGMNYDEFKALSSFQRDSEIIKTLIKNSRNLRLLSPAESINSLSVGALFADNCDEIENPRHLIPCSNGMLSPISSLGRGINKSIKPDILFPGGRSALLQNLMEPQKAHWRLNTNVTPPGILSARPRVLAGGGSIVGYSFGTSNATALISHNATICYDVLKEIFIRELGVEPPPEYTALLLKSMLAHGAEWGDLAAAICKIAELSGRGADDIHKWLGYGVPEITRVLECAKNRITLIGYGELGKDEACEYKLPLPFDFSTKKYHRCLTATLASFSPIRPSTQKYRSAQIWYTIESEGDKPVPKRQDASDKAVARGTLQHERFYGNNAVVWSEDEYLGIKVNCRADANDFVEKIPYALFVTFEIAPEHDIDVYQKIVEKVRQRETITTV